MQQNIQLTVAPFFVFAEDALHLRREMLLCEAPPEAHVEKRSLERLQKQLKKQGYASEKQIFLAVCDADGNLSCYPME